MPSINISSEEVKGVVLHEMPDENETMADHFELKNLLPIIKAIDHYYRDASACPFGRGNWVIDLRCNNGELFSIKLPKEMTAEHFDNFIKPLIERFQKFKQEIH